MTPLPGLPDLPHTRLRATFRAQAPARLPPLEGSMLRGAFGHALRAAVCAMKPDQPCATCLLRGPCIYTRLFETFVDGDRDGDPPPFLRGVETSPRPYVVEPQTERGRYERGDTLETDLVLVGQAMELIPYVILALGRMAPRGFGKDRVPFRLEQVRALRMDGTWQPAVEPGGGSGSSPRVRPAPVLRPRSLPDLGTGPLTLRFPRPTRLLKKGQALEEVTFRHLVYAMLRRVLEVAHFHVPGAAPSWELSLWLDRASEVEVTRSDLRWAESSRYSSRQGRRHSTGGFVGEVEVQGDVALFLPLLGAAEVLHVGKGATFGLGRVEVGA